MSEEKPIEPLVIDMAGTPVNVKTKLEVIPADPEAKPITFQCWEVPGMNVCFDQPDPVDPKTLVDIKERDALKEGQTVIVGVIHGHTRMTVTRGKHKLYLENETLVSTLDFDEKWGWLATGFINKKAIEKMTEIMKRTRRIE